MTDAGEFWQVELLPLEKFRQQLRAGKLTDVALGYLALDHLDLLCVPPFRSETKPARADFEIPAAAPMRVK
jgi:hypothetical protein